MTTSERRTAAERLEFRAEGDDLIARGYAAVFGASYRTPYFTEVIAPGAFRKTLKEQDVVALANHDANLLLGRMSAGTLRLQETSRGLLYDVTLPNTAAGRDWAELLRRGDVIGSSFGFRVIREDWTPVEDELPLRTLQEVALRDVGPVTFPAYSDTSAGLRHLAEARSLDIDDLVAAATEGRLRDLLVPEVTNRSDDADDEGRAERTDSTPAVIRHVWQR